MRLHAQTADDRERLRLAPDEAHWLADYVAELTAFPVNRPFNCG